ncbi:hypothetical protein ACFSHQ_01915 [Gemmobacter lanyuensis]
MPDIGGRRTAGTGADLAILGLDLRGEQVFDLADQLRRSRVPFVFYSALDLSQIPCALLMCIGWKNRWRGMRRWKSCCRNWAAPN